MQRYSFIRPIPPRNAGDRYADLMKDDVFDCKYYKTCTKSSKVCNKDCIKYISTRKLK